MVLVGCAAGGDRAQEGSEPAAPSELVVVPECRVAVPLAAVHASELERVAEARHQRAPFAATELPDAVAALLEAERCHVRAQAREAAARVRLRVAVLQAELTRRTRREALALELARRTGDHGEVARAAEVLRLLHGRAGPEAAAYRRWLEQLARVSRAVAARTAKERS
jgi:hypothetical protein